MASRLNLHTVTVVCCAAVAALMPAKASAHISSSCFTFQGYDGQSRTVGIKNNCSECRTAAIHWCDGTTLHLKVSGSRTQRVQGYPGCGMQIMGDNRCAQPSPNPPGRRLSVAPKATPPSPDRSPRAPSNQNHPPVPDQAAGGTKDSQAGDAAASIAATGDTPGGRLAVSSLQDAPAVPLKIEVKTPTRMAVFPSASAYDWGTLLCSERGTGLIRQTDALLDRRAVLQIMLGELWFSPDAVEKQDEWMAAEKEVDAINRELSKFQERAKAIINRN